MKKILILIFLLFIFINGKATDYGLIIGIGHYKNIADLHNIDKDVKTYTKILKNWGVTKAIVLKDENATKKNILDSLDDIISKIKTGDRFFMFFSGHGSSLKDESFSQKLKSLELKEAMKDSGAILPYDFDENNLSKTMIIGKIDLRNRLEKIDEKVTQSIIVFDACFSRNSIKDIGDNSINLTPNILTDTKDYPYKHIVYIASSIIQAKAGKFSPILDTCLKNPFLVNEIKGCINTEIGNSMQIPAIFSN